MKKKTQKRLALGVAGLKGGSGKTLVSLALIRLLRKKGLVVGPFKKGPDYIDPEWLGLAAGLPCFCLDAYLMDRSMLQRAFFKAHQQCDIVLVEANRGVFDGLDSLGSYSFAEIAKLLGIPVILVIDCTKVTTTTAAFVKGVQALDPDLLVVGVILNRLAGSRQQEVATEAIRHFTGLPVLGAIPKFQGEGLSEHSLGLVPPIERSNPGRFLNVLAKHLTPYLKLEEILQAAVDSSSRALFEGNLEPLLPTSRNNPKIGILQDQAFHFYYEENLRALRAQGAGLVPINALNDKSLPSDIHGLYIGGGFPERFAEALAANISFKESLKRAILSGLPVYAECGGFLYLSKALQIESQEFPMVGIFPFRFKFEFKPQAHGYTAFRAVSQNPYYPLGQSILGHEFRYARVINPKTLNQRSFVFNMERGVGLWNGLDGALFRNALGSFQHTHAFSKNVAWIKSLVRMAKRSRG